MTANLPIVDPIKLGSPVLIVRGEYDGIATEEDLLNFFQEAFELRPAVRHDSRRHTRCRTDHKPPINLFNNGPHPFLTNGL